MLWAMELLPTNKPLNQITSNQKTTSSFVVYTVALTTSSISHLTSSCNNIDYSYMLRHTAMLKADRKLANFYLQTFIDRLGGHLGFCWRLAGLIIDGRFGANLILNVLTIFYQSYNIFN